MTVFEFLSSLNSLDIKVWIEDDQLRYRAPKGVMTSALKQELIERKAEIFSCLQEARTAKKLAFEPILSINRDCDLPLSFSQQRMWLLNQLDSENPSYNESFQFRITGTLNVAALEQSLNEIIRRHEALRTIFPIVDGLVVQRIVPTLTINIPVVDLQGLEEAEIQQLVTKEVRQPFDLAISPLLRVTLLRQEVESYLLILTMHHIIMDGWSIKIFLQELSTIYQAFSTRSPNPLPELIIQYGDFAVWQQKWLTEELQQQQLDYWKQQLADAPPLLELPTDYPRPSVQTVSSAVKEWKLNSNLTAQLRNLSQQSGTTLFVTLLAAFAVLLHRYSGQDDICIGSPFANRNRTEIQPLIGFFINTLVLRTQIKDNPSFKELMSKAHCVFLDAHAYQDVAFEQVVEALQPERCASYNPLFQVWFNLLNFGDMQLELPGLSVEALSRPQTASKFDLNLYVTEQKQSIQLEFVYNADLFNADTIAKMLLHYQTLLESIVTNPEQQISTLPLLTEAEHYYLKNCSNVVYPSNPFITFDKEDIEQSISARFKEQVRKYPHHIAVHTNNYHWTYSDLNYHANQVAQAILKQCTSKEERIALLFEHNAPMIAGILGVLKVGKSYVPLDPSYPTERVVYILGDSRASAVLTNNKNLARAQELTNGVLPIINIDNISSFTGSFNEAHLEISPDTIAYILYTSGSTGQPKGVIQNHRNVLHFIRNYTNNLHINKLDRLTLLSSYSFDAALMDIFAAILNGATLYPINIKEEGLTHLFEILQQQKITIYHSTPTLYRHFVSTLSRGEKLNEIRLVVLGGEEVVKTDVDLYKEHFSNECIFVNGLGPTESTVSLQYFINKQTEITRNTVPVGYPVEETEILLLNEAGEKTDIYGEIAIRSPHVALGYWHKPDLTQVAFLPDPELSSRRIYRTGDLGRLRPDGSLEFLGRKDFQVKIRGFRIELGEIEAAIAQHPSVRETVVIATEDVLANKYLVAYVVARQIVTDEELRHILKQKLPDYMVPSSFVFLDSLPLTPNRKINRRALPKPELHQKLSDKYVAPRSPIEEMLAQIWTQVLRVEQVGIHDNFFELGGHSLLATQLLSRIRNIFKVELPLRSVFAAATVAGLAQSIGQLQQQNLELTAPPILRRASDAQLPLSFAQQRLWFLDQFEPNSAIYNIPIALRLVGNLNWDALEQSLQQIIARHEALRTNFITVDGKPSQIIQTQIWTVSVVDLQDLPATEQESAFKLLAQQQCIDTFDLAKGALIRARLLVLSETEHILLVCMHHIVSDGWSIGVFVQELTALYNAYSIEEPSPLAPLPIQYADFAIWQRNWLQGSVLQTQLSYWQQQLAGAPALLSLPTDRPRPAVQTFAGAHLEFALSFELTGRLVKLSQEQGCTLFMTLLAAFDTLLYRYTGQEDILVGTPIANRDRSEIEGLIGFFVNTLVLRTDLSGNLSFSELLSRVREIALLAYAHQDLPFEMLVEALQPERDLGHTPLFQVMFVLQNAPMSQLELAGLTVSRLSVERTTAKFDLTLSMENTAAGLVGVWEYNTDLFDASTIEQMTGHFVTLLEGIVANPQQHLAQLPLLTQSEQQQLLVEWNDTQVDSPLDKCIHQLFEEQSFSTPDAVAVVFANQQLTYKQLNCRANQLAHYLQTLGVKPDVLVGICVERSLEMVVGLLGVLKAGGAYVPLDPDYPTERLSFMLEDAQISVLLTQQGLVDRLPEHQAKLVCLDEVWEQIAQNNQDNPTSVVRAFHLANVIYTSGSTGTPKGVMVEHTGLCNLAQAQIQTFGLHSDSRILQFASFSFDASIWEVVMALGSGATLYLGTKDSLLPGIALIERLRDYCITHITLPPSALAVMPIEELPALQTMIVAGEACSAKLIRQWSAGRNFFNAYGPTEATVCATIAKCTDGDEKISIGRAIANTQIYILDSYLQPVPVGIVGEIHIGGVGLARGYLNRRELTQEKFIPNPFSTDPDSRLYKTGDLGRYLPDGNIEYLGRIDNQVKVRGFRIELGEIQAVLSQHGDVQVSCVIAREDTTEDKRLVAYVVPHQHCTLTISELRHFLKAKLPEYMVPNAFVILEEMPLTPNGKVDRRALPAPDFHSERKNKFVAPRTPIEEMLAQIWAQVLRVKQVGIHDNFFELGGHSLLATQLVSRIRTWFKVELPLRELFARVTVAELAHLIGQLQQQNLELISPPILPRALNAELPLSFAQTRLWFLDQLEPNSAFYNIPLALRLVGTLNQVALEESLHEIIARHEALRTNFVIVDGQSTQIIHTQMNWRMSVIDLRHLSTTEKKIATQQLVQQQTIQPFDLASESLIRATLVILSETEHILLVCMHHIVSDGWSMGVFIQELAALYNAYSQGQPSPLTPLSIQYADFAIWQRNWLQGDVLQTQLNYWQQQLKDAPALLSLPTDRPRPAVQTFAGACQKFALSKELTDGLTQLSQQQGVTLFITLLAAFDTLLYRYTGVADILVGTPIANRDRSEIEGLIGFFVNTLVMRTNLAGNPSFCELLTRVRDMAMSAYTHQNLPFEMLVEALQPQRDLSHTPLFQVMFALQNAPMSQLDLTGLAASPLVVENVHAKFDLTLAMENTAQGLVGVWEYNTDLFDASTIERMALHFVTLLEGIVANPQQSISQLPLLTEVERQQLLVDWNNTQADYPCDKCIHQLFEEQSFSTPDAVAVVYGNQQLTYEQLNCRANQLAHYLKILGVRADVVVGLCVERSLEMVVGMLGVLKAGGAYVPLDPEYPIERLHFMLEDAQVKVLLIQKHLIDRLPEHQTQLVCLDSDWQMISESSNSNLVNNTIPENLAYVIYTSGSTGKPKGVMIEHQSLVNFTAATKVVYGLNSSDRILQFSSISFDSAVDEIYNSLTCGGTLVLRTDEMLNSVSTFVRKCREWKVTVLQLPTAYWQHFTSELAMTNEILPTSVRLVVTGGEQVLSEKLKLWRKCVDDRLLCHKLGDPPLLINGYGPSEATVEVTICNLSKLVLEDIQTQVPVGRPINNVQIYILDQYLQPVPIGIAGELYIGGICLARGYFNQPELTAEKFIQNPFSTDMHSRLYKTGDKARYLPNGNIEYLGRIDHQVKIRGFRIELGEIEAVLSQHDDVQACVVIADEETPGVQRLVAYVVPHQNSTLTVSELRHFLKTKLPLYMVPNAFVILETLPLTTNSKVDRHALRRPCISSGSDRFIAPRNQLELQLTQLWSKILKIDKVGVQDNFFDLGGHSLLAPYLMTQIKQQFGKNIPLASLFQNPTIEQLATIVQEDSDSSIWSPLVAIQPNGYKPPLFCIPGAGGNPFYLYNLARCLGQDQPFYSFQANSFNGELESITQVEDIAAHYIQALQVVQPQGPYFLAGHSFGGTVAFEMAQQLLHQGHGVALVAIVDTTAPFYHEKPTGVDWDNATWLTKFATVMQLVFAKNLDISYETLQPLVWEEQLTYVLQQLQMADILPPDSQTTQLNNLVQAYKANIQVAYVPQQVYPTRIVLLRSSEASVEEPTSELPSEILQDSTWGWSKFSAEPVDIHFVPGSHITMMTQPHVQVLAERLKAYIQKA